MSKDFPNYEFHIKSEGMDKHTASISLDENSLPEALNKLSMAYPIKYSIEGQAIHVEVLDKYLVHYRGTVAGTDGNPLTSATVTLYRMEDSLAIRQTMSNNYGVFDIACFEDSALIRITHPGHKALGFKTTQCNLGKLVMQGRDSLIDSTEVDVCQDVASAQSAMQAYNNPAFPGGNTKLLQFMRETAWYPSGIKGKKDLNVVVELVILEDGTPVFGKMKRPSAAKDPVVREVKSLIKAMPAWKPATSVLPDGRIVAEKSVVELTIPFCRKYAIGFYGPSIKVEKAGTLAQQMTQAQMDTCRILSVSGPINSKDILTLRYMAGADGGKGHLEQLDLSNARIVTDKETPYLTLDMAKSGAMVWVSEREAVKDKTQFKAYTPMFMGTQNTIRHYNESTPRLMAATDQSTPTYTITHSPGWVGNYQNERRYMEEASHWVATITLNPTKMRMKRSLYEKGEDPNQVEDLVVNKDTAGYKLTKLQLKNIRKLKGQYVNKVNGRYIYKSYTRKNNFCRDMFYECSSLKKVVLPNGTKPNNNVYVLDAPIRYI